jgi:hypothetical protein
VMAEKISKLEAHYQSMPFGAQRCARCTMFRSPDTCTAVRGEVEYKGWCKLFERKDVSKA